ncbi:MAG: hypothetical protein P8Q40_05860, partial [Candidatus Poseidonia sp.]|uniref:hypothetical protein n=1 Tax=Poseidonia sp. TaxID=2666344 RepID=UPI0030C21FD2|nr:hypothetical protein [Poseidonia sp.]
MDIEELNLTEILTALQDFMTQDGAISLEQRDFYKAFRTELNGHEGEFLIEDVERLLIATRVQVDSISDEDFSKMGEAI